MAALSSNFLKQIAHAMQEEEIDVYALSLYCMSSDDLSFFSEPDRSEILRIFKVLIDETQHHTELLKLVMELAEKS